MTQNHLLDWPDALIDAKLSTPKGLSSWNGSDVTHRFGVYRNNVVISLIDALASTFPITQALVGVDFFRAMAHVFIQKERPETAQLICYGENFPEFILQFSPANQVPYLSEVARLEHNYVQSYHAADESCLDASALGQLLSSEIALENLHFCLHPSLRILTSDFAIFSLWAAHQGFCDISSVNPYEPQGLWMIRNGLHVHLMQMPLNSCVFAHALQKGKNFEHACAAALEEDENFDLTFCLTTLIQNPIITQVNSY